MGLPFPLKLSGLQSLWSLDEMAGVTVYDYKGSNNGTITGADRVKLTNGARGLSFVQANSDKLALGNIGNIKTIGMWLKLGTTTEKIFEGAAGSLLVFVNAGSLSYADFDNVFVDGVDTDTITTGWHWIVFTSTTDVNCTALTIALNDATYGDLVAGFIFTSTSELAQEEIKAIYRSTYRR